MSGQSVGRQFLNDLCVVHGFCGSDGKTVVDLLPPTGKIDAPTFVSLVFEAEGLDETTAHRHARMLTRYFTESFGSNGIDVSFLSES